MEIKPIAFIRTDFREKFGIPRQSGRVPNLLGKIIFEKDFQDDNALRGIEEFSHLWLFFDFSKNHRKKWSPTVRPPRLGGNLHLGVFATRSPFRPNNLGLSCVKFEGIEKSEKMGSILIVSGVDLLDKTPIYDIKPYIPYCDCKTDAKGSFSSEFKDYRLDVIYENSVFCGFPEDKKQALINCIAEDPRPAYQEDENRIYKMSFAEFNVSFKVSGKSVEILKIEKI